MASRLVRSQDRIIAGVVAGLAEQLHMDPTVLRLIVVVLFFFSLGIPIIVLYLVAWIIMPEA
jgi:phage shock protein C